MITVYKSELRGELLLRRGELKNLLKEREHSIERGAHNPFKRRSSKDLEENIRLCRQEIRRIERNLANKSY